MDLAVLRPPRSRQVHFHWPLLVCTLSIALLGIYNMHSSASHRAPSLWLTQALWVGLGSLLLLAMAKLDYRLTHAVAYVSLGVATLALVLVLLVGRYIMGARRWLSFAGLTVQPSELAKLALIFGLARYFATRLPQGGYTIRGLLRPLLWTRPATAAGLALAAWRRPWLLDPVGELARLVRLRLPAPPAIENLWWCRGLLVLALAASASVSVAIVLGLANRAALLNPWPPNRRRRWLWGAFAWHVGLLALCLSHWHSPLLMDPIGVALATLWRAAEQGGSFAAPQDRWWPRALLGAAIGAWGVFAWLFGRHVDAAPASPGAKPSQDLPARHVAPVDLLLVPALLVLVQPDLGSAMLLVVTGTSMVLAVGLRRRSLLYLTALTTIAAGLTWALVLQEYQKRRIWTFMDPEQDIRGAGWNAVQSLIAVGSGRFFGKGHKNGTQTQLSFLPEQHTDFAFSVWAEEQGLFGCGMLLLLYFSMTVLGWQVAMRAREPYGALLAVGLVALLAWQAVINVGMVIGVLPVVGIPLPLFSYGGSSTLIVLASVGLLLSVHQRAR